MTNEPEFDLQAAHKYFSAQCFNRAWDLIDNTDRTPEEDRAMIQLNMASNWHWSQREDCTNKNLAIGYWQSARIFALLGQADTARKYGKLSLDYSQGEKPFYIAYAYEALARAEDLAGNSSKAQEYLVEARKLSQTIEDAESRKMLEADLDTIKAG